LAACLFVAVVLERGGARFAGVLQLGRALRAAGTERRRDLFTRIFAAPGAARDECYDDPLANSLPTHVLSFATNQQPCRGKHHLLADSLRMLVAGLEAAALNDLHVGVITSSLLAD
jgi:hypothetical protein